MKISKGIVYGNNQCDMVTQMDGGTRNCIYVLGHPGPHSFEIDTPITPNHYQGDYVMRIIEDFKLDFLRGTIIKYYAPVTNPMTVNFRT